MRRIEIQTPLPAPAAVAWQVFVDVDRWPEWGRLVRSAWGELAAGHRWVMELRDEDGSRPRTLRPRLISIQPPRQVVFESVFVGAWAVRLVHVFDIEPAGPETSVLRQSFEATGALIVPLWRWLEPGMAQFEALGRDLARRLGGAEE